MAKAGAERQQGTGPEMGQLKPEMLRLVKDERTQAEIQSIPEGLEKLSPVERVLESYRYEVGQNVARPGAQETWQVTGLSEDGEVIYLKQNNEQGELDFISLERHDLALDEITVALSKTAAELWDEAVNELAEIPGTREDAPAFRARVANIRDKVLNLAALEAFKKTPEILKSKNDLALKFVLRGVLREQLAERNRVLRREPHPQVQAADAIIAADDYIFANAEFRHPEDFSEDEDPMERLMRGKLELLKVSRQPNLSLLLPDLTYRGNLSSNSDEIPVARSDEYEDDLDEEELKSKRLQRKLKRTEAALPPTLAELKARSKEAWAKLRNAHQNLEKRIRKPKDDPRSYYIWERYEEYNDLYKQALASDLAVEEARRLTAQIDTAPVHNSKARVFSEMRKTLQEQAKAKEDLPTFDGSKLESFDDLENEKTEPLVAAEPKTPVPKRRNDLRLKTPQVKREPPPPIPEEPWSFRKMLRGWLNRE